MKIKVEDWNCRILVHLSGGLFSRALKKTHIIHGVMAISLGFALLVSFIHILNYWFILLHIGRVLKCLGSLSKQNNSASQSHLMKWVLAGKSALFTTFLSLCEVPQQDCVSHFDVVTDVNLIIPQ